jgi:hypothetical protein
MIARARLCDSPAAAKETVSTLRKLASFHSDGHGRGSSGMILNNLEEHAFNPASDYSRLEPVRWQLDRKKVLASDLY